MLDVLYYPVSAVLWAWHQLFGAVFGPTSGLSWALAVVFLVLCVRAVLVPSALRRMRAARVTRRLAPELARLRERHRGDPRALAERSRALHAEHGSSPLAGYGPMLLQLPVFVAVLHVLRSFNRPGLTFEQNAALANYAFGPDDVRSFLAARLFGTPLSAWLTMPDDLLASFGGTPVGHAAVAAVVVPLAVLAALATFLTTRLARSEAGPAAAGQQGAIMARVFAVLPWAGSAAVLVGGLAFPIPVALLVYWLAGSVATLVQQVVLTRVLDRAEARGSAVPAVPIAAATGDGRAGGGTAGSTVGSAAGRAAGGAGGGPAGSRAGRGGADRGRGARSRADRGSGAGHPTSRTPPPRRRRKPPRSRRPRHR